jgi:hypothetical protein
MSNIGLSEPPVIVTKCNIQPSYRVGALLQTFKQFVIS